MLRVDQLRDEQWSRAVGDGNTEAEKQAADDEEGDVETEREQDDADDHDRTADDDAGTATKDVGGVRNERDGEHGTDGHRGSDEAQNLGAGVVEVGAPLVHTLQTVDERAVISCWRDKFEYIGWQEITESGSDRELTVGC